MSSATVLSICNRSLLSIGARNIINNLQEGSTQATACNVLFTPTFESLARSANWNCLRKELTLSLLQAATGTPENPNGTTLAQPPTPWLYAYALPSDCLKVRFIVPSLPASAPGSIPLTTASVTSATWLPGGAQIPYAVAYSTDAQNNPIQIILTNQTQAVAVYTVNQPNPVIWDSLFQQAMVSSLAAFLVPALSLHMTLMQAAIKTADAMIAQARTADGNEGVTVMDHIPDWMQARSSGTLLNGLGEVSLQNYSNMAWPVF